MEVIMTNTKHPTVNAQALPLRPAMHPTVESFLANKKLVKELVNAFGSPLNVMFPELLAGNIASFTETFARHQVIGRICFAHKSTRSDSLIKQLAVEDVSLDAASVNELKHALGAGFAGKRLEATGPKNAEFLCLCLQHGVVLNIDSVAEIARIAAIAKRLKLEQPARVLVRLSGFGDATTASLRKSSRFGVPLSTIDEALNLLEEHKESMTLLGFSFHLDTTSIEERIQAIETCISLFDEALNRGFAPQVLNIGGGFRVNYLAQEQDWSNYVAALKESVLGGRKPLTWQNTTFGLSVEGRTLKGNFNSYNFFEVSPGARFLEEILSCQMPSRNDTTVAEVLSSNMIELWIEPGRALLDQCGVTIARVNSARKASGGEQLVSLNMKRSDIAFLDQEMFVDPVVLYRRAPPEQKPADQPVFFAGNLCLESDLILRHATFLKQLPQSGDLIAFVNTAGYAMDFSSSNAIMQPPARKIAVVSSPKFSWVLDEQFSPMWRYHEKEL
jgi:diaminopimelate decarboxylase